ncbi:hypothetical protein QBC47DRAFT_291364 [Echria macrotheca]|uniref:VOC domain-containing protein n=1 Tax=Echria macrotheca TaxID=438768 RepID=A0AAJ0BN88_9PEZI|nr:hypothetical protein QBC47DRAFT_291364 [Echria macrotheca]
MSLASAHLRVARPTNSIDALLPFYCVGLGFEVAGRFVDHDGVDGIMLKISGDSSYHLEFTQTRGHDAGRAPTKDNLLVFYLADETAYDKAVERMQSNGFAAVKSFNPYWDRCGKTFEDADGYRVVLANMASPVRVPSHRRLLPTKKVAMKRLGFFLGAAALVSGQQTGNHPDWPRWCGKVYEPGYPNYDPGGQAVPPTPVPGPPLVHVQFQPRYSLYLSDETEGEFIVDAPYSQFFGTAWPNITSSSSGNNNKLIFSIHLVADDTPLVQNSVTVNTTTNIFTFNLSLLTPSPSPIPVVLYGAPEGGHPTWTATSTVYYLPPKAEGSVTRIDLLRGGLWFRQFSPSSPSKFTPLLPYGFYTSYDGFLRNATRSSLAHYTSLGLNAMTPLTTVLESPSSFADMDSLSLRYMYDLRERYKNLSSVTEHTLAARSLPNLFAYWTADEPDGWQDPFSAPLAAYETIKSLDPYHPVALVLNCQNYYFSEYEKGADILMADVYPIGINATYSKWDTPCNVTYGDCGCDNCAGTLQDVPRRLDDLVKYESYIGKTRQKTKIFNPQAFHGEGYWLRDPSPAESWAMVVLALNHAAKGIISWVWPTSDILARAHGELARVVTNAPVVDFLVAGEGPDPIKVEIEGEDEIEVVDVATWERDDGTVLVSVVNGGYVDIRRRVEVAVPGATVIRQTHWGNVSWTLEGEKLSVGVLPALAVSMVVLDLKH